MYKTYIIVLCMCISVNPVYACATCYSSEGGAQWAYKLTTVAMMLIPLALVVGCFIWLKKAAHAQEVVGGDKTSDIYVNDQST